MKLAIFTTFAFPIAFTEAAGVRYGAIPPELIGAEQLPFGDFVAAPCEGCAPNYCYPKYEDPDYECYKEGYPKCCSRKKGNCPNNRQPKCECEDQGGCTKGNTGTKDEDAPGMMAPARARISVTFQTQRAVLIARRRIRAGAKQCPLVVQGICAEYVAAMARRMTMSARQTL
eukprot:CAMPEP_0196138430 /NCGR_PEP_ID=MMETSP0910-20130528/6075_1 /TAXON_ID=49265 /ORGANISM="Thalassiosira rotula, Strain GSO102" /LENGTH=171 /DNA_ID=CAMNT_0041399035 /DNA_START=99 /DNA_END=615 /DNA_ORIENTATION=-